MKFLAVVVGAGSLAILGAVICIIASVYPKKKMTVDGDNSTMPSEGPLRALEPEAVAQAGPLGALHGGSSYDGENSLGGVGLDLPSLNELGQNPALSFSRLVCTPLPLGDCSGQVQADEPVPGAEEDWSGLRATAEELQQVILQQNQQILMDQRTIRELTGKLSECESGLEELPAPERSVDVWTANRRIMAGDEVGSTAAQLQTARAVEELARAIMDLKDRIEKLEAEIGPPALNRSDSFSGASPRRPSTPPPPAAGSPGPHRPVHPPKPSKGQAARPKTPWRVEDLEGELERKIKLLEKERQAMRKETGGAQDKMSSGSETVSPVQQGVGEPSFPEGFVLSFPMRTNYMYGVVRREVTEMYAFTACLWLRPTEGGIGTPFSYSVPGQPNELVLLQGAHNPVELLINDKVAQLPLDLPRGQWQHVCVSWTLRDGVWKAYQSGRLKGRGEGLAAWHPIKPGGVLILGQEQDTVGGRFDASQALVGELSQFNLWDRVLKPAEVSALAECSSSALGNIAPWTDLDVDVYGGATKESTEPCHGTHKTPSPNQ